MKNVPLYCFLTIILFFPSCVFHRNYKFSRLDSLQSLNGIYENRDNIITRSLNMRDEKDVDLVRFEFTDSQTLNVSCLVDSGFGVNRTFKGKFKPEKGYFEIVFGKKWLCLLIFYHHSSDKVRIGRDTFGKLFLTKEVAYRQQTLIVFGEAYDYDYGESLGKVEGIVLRPALRFEKWGYADPAGKIVIRPVYDFAWRFEGEVARVLKDKKWGLIDKAGNEILPPAYSEIEEFGTQEVARAYHNKKTGFINRAGKEVVPVMYDKIDDVYTGDSITTTMLNGKYGFVSYSRVIVPPVFDHAMRRDDVTGHNKAMKRILPGYVGTAEVDRVRYAVDEDGYIYKMAGRSEIEPASRKHWTELPVPQGQQNIHRLFPVSDKQ
ncbi:WG repeat-containing protein [Dysgonomonas gadei]|nr:WG repeat-containing protein [Dysgonomonas gadei]